MAGPPSIASDRFSRQMRAARQLCAIPLVYSAPPGSRTESPLFVVQALSRRTTRVVTPHLDHVWQQIQGALLQSVGERTYGLWLAPLRCVSLDGDTLVLDGPPEVSAWASQRLSGALASAAASVLGPTVAVSIAGQAVPAPAAASRVA